MGRKIIMKKVSVVIPLYNSSKTIEEVIDEVTKEFQRLNKYELEMVLVNDCSPDNVFELVSEIAKKRRDIKVLDLAKNSGQTNAMFAGYKYATGDYIVNMDDDLQMPGYEIGNMLEALETRGLDVVFAKYKKQRESSLRLFGSKINTFMTEMMIGKPKNVKINNFFVMRKFVKDAICQYSNNYPYVYGIIFKVTSRVGNVLCEHRERTNGKSNYTLKKLLALWLNGFLNFSVKPLRIATSMGVIITAISFIIGLILIIQRIINPNSGVLGWTSTIVTVIFLSGVQLFSIGILGEYLGRLYISSSKLPTYVVREKINCGELDNEDNIESEDNNEN